MEYFYSNKTRFKFSREILLLQFVALSELRPL
jgi:hypothetical protein